jgi:hypothetical protein
MLILSEQASAGYSEWVMLGARQDGCWFAACQAKLRYELRQRQSLRGFADMPCGVCGRTASHAARDVQVRQSCEGEDPFYRYFKPQGEWWFWCIEHPVRSATRTQV